MPRTRFVWSWIAIALSLSIPRSIARADEGDDPHAFHVGNYPLLGEAVGVPRGSFDVVVGERKDAKTIGTLDDVGGTFVGGGVGLRRTYEIWDRLRLSIEIQYAVGTLFGSAVASTSSMEHVSVAGGVGYQRRFGRL